MLRTRKENPLASPDPRMTSLSWLAGIDFGCAQPVGDEVSGAAPHEAQGSGLMAAGQALFSSVGRA
jgi:hypothetical protein